jgi:hypothetical protein
MESRRRFDAPWSKIPWTAAGGGLAVSAASGEKRSVKGEVSNMRSGLLWSAVAAVLALALGLEGCERKAVENAAPGAPTAEDLVAKEFVKRPVFNGVVTRKDPIGRTVVCGTAAGTMNVPVPVKANEPPRDKPLYTPTAITTRFYVVEGEAVLEHQNSLYAGVNPAVKASADDYQALTLQWFRIGWEKLCTDQPAQPAPPAS